MKIYETIVIGGGPSGISCVYHLKNLGIDYLLIEQKEMLQTWKYERWDSFHLVTPNWMTNLPGVEHLIPYDNAYMSRSEIEHVLLAYMKHVEPNYVENTVIDYIEKKEGYYCLHTNTGQYHAKHLIVAVGMFNQPFVPELSKLISSDVHQLHSMDYYNPKQLKAGATVVVGAGRSGVQIALEVKKNTPYECYLSVGSLTPLPVIYKSFNGVYWLNRLSGYNENNKHLPYETEDFKNPNIINKLDQNLYHCQKEGVKLIGRMVSVTHDYLEFADNLHETLQSGTIYRKNIESNVDDLIKNEAIQITKSPINFETSDLDLHTLKSVHQLEFKSDVIKNIIWCTGFSPNYKWLTLDIFDAQGKLNLKDGASETENIYFCGMGLQPDSRTKSSFGVGLFAVVESAKRAVDLMLSRRKETSTIKS